jgi:hypothetical protein
MKLLQVTKEILKPFYNNIIYFYWIIKGCPIPPPHIAKRKFLKLIASKYSLNNFVETGTFKGDMINALKDNFSKLYSIEVSKILYNDAKNRFIGINKIQIIEGDSAIRLKELINVLNEPALFWLDAHCSEGITSQGEKYTPILDEISIILKSNYKHVIIIDDLRLFGSDINYPSYSEIQNLVLKINANQVVSVKYDFILITPGDK